MKVKSNHWIQLSTILTIAFLRSKEVKILKILDVDKTIK